MSKTKVEHTLRAFRYLRISGLTTTPSPGEKADALETLEDMMHEFRSRNICSSYVFEDDIDPNTNSEVADEFNNALATCLALRLAPDFGITINTEIRAMATSGLSNWSARTGKTNMINPSNRQPRGSGNTYRFPNWIRFYRTGENAPISCSTFNLKVDAIDFFTVDFSGYLLDGSTITSFTTENTNGIQLINSVQDVDKINLECKGLIAGFNTVTITVTTSAGRVNPETINFNIT